MESSKHVTDKSLLLGDLHRVDDPAFCRRWFGEDGRGIITLSTFRSYVLSVQYHVSRLEFELYDVDNSGSLDAHEFARMIVSSV